MSWRVASRSRRCRTWAYSTVGSLVTSSGIVPGERATRLLTSVSSSSEHAGSGTPMTAVRRRSLGASTSRISSTLDVTMVTSTCHTSRAMATGRKTTRPPGRRRPGTTSTRSHPMASPVITLAGDAEPHSSTQIVANPTANSRRPHGASTASR